MPRRIGHESGASESSRMSYKWMSGRSRSMVALLSGLLDLNCKSLASVGHSFDPQRLARFFFFNIYLK